jgi:hypothetical protein
MKTFFQRFVDSCLFHTRYSLVCKDRAKLSFKGYWHDKITYLDSGKVEVRPWQYNQIQLAAAVVAATALSRQPELTAYTGMGYLAVGSGLVGWDTVPPTILTSQTTLTTETFRKAISASNLSFVDALGGSVSATPTRFYRLVVQLGSSEANGTLREFGIFGGDATLTFDSGSIFNHIVNSRIDKDSNMVIDRTVDIEVLEP